MRCVPCVIFARLAVFVADTCGFKKSTAKKSESLRFVPCNLHIQRMRAKATGKGNTLNSR